MAKRFIVRLIAFFGLIVPSFLLLALLAAPARPQPLEPAGCVRNLADSNASMAAMQAHLAGARGADYPAHGQSEAASRANLLRHLIIGAADATGNHFDLRLGIFQSAVENSECVFFGIFLHQIQRIIYDPFGDGLLAVLHHVIYEASQIDAIMLGVRFVIFLMYAFLSHAYFLAAPPLPDLAPYLERCCLRF